MVGCVKVYWIREGLFGRYCEGDWVYEIVKMKCFGVLGIGNVVLVGKSDFCVLNILFIVILNVKV